MNNWPTLIHPIISVDFERDVPDFASLMLKVNSVPVVDLLLCTLHQFIDPRLLSSLLDYFPLNRPWSPDRQALSRQTHSSSPTKPNTYQPQTKSLPNAHLNHHLQQRDHEPIHAQHINHQYLPPVVRPSLPLSHTRHQGCVPRYRERL
jgi:hypothetical protein